MSQIDNERREDLRSLLFELSESQKILESKKERAKVFIRLEKIYFSAEEEQEFRHFYSDIFSWLTQIDTDSSKSIDVLAQNLGVLQKGYKATNIDSSTKSPINISKNLNKLYDHVNLDVARINYLKSVNSQMKATIKIDDLEAKATKLEGDTQALAKQAKEIEKTAMEAEKAVNNAQRDSTAILGIFAAIVLAFTGGMIFSTSVFENIEKASIYRIGLLAVLIAFTLLNVVYFLLEFIAAIGKIDKIGINIKAINIFLIVLVVIIILGWLFDISYLAELLRIKIYHLDT